MKYLVNADDFGRTETVNKAIIKCFEQDIITHASIMVNMPYYDAAKNWAFKNNRVENIGFHLNLTSGLPLTNEICTLSSFCKKDGNFNGEIFKNIRLAFFLFPKEKKAVIKEIEAQIIKYLNDGFLPIHADSHGHIHTFPSLAKITTKLFSKYGFYRIRISRNINLGFMKKQYKYFINGIIQRANRLKLVHFGSLNEYTNNLQSINNQEGVSEIMLHPNIWDGDLQIGEGKHFEDIPIDIKNNLF